MSSAMTYFMNPQQPNQNGAICKLTDDDGQSVDFV